MKIIQKEWKHVEDEFRGVTIRKVNMFYLDSLFFTLHFEY